MPSTQWTMHITHYIDADRDLKDNIKPWWAACICAEQSVGFDGKHDAYYCRECYAWLEEVCGEGHCDYCASRPMINEQARKLDDSLEASFLLVLESEFGRQNEYWNRCAP